jgi:hypothetical protein
MRPPQSSLVRNSGTDLSFGLGRCVETGPSVVDYDLQEVWMRTVASFRLPELLIHPPNHCRVLNTRSTDR